MTDNEILDKIKPYDTVIKNGESYLFIPVHDYEYYKAKAEKLDKYMALSWYSEEKSPKEVYGVSFIKSKEEE